jgi:hypothetical protein
MTENSLRALRARSGRTDGIRAAPNSYGSVSAPIRLTPRQALRKRSCPRTWRPSRPLDRST